MNNVSPIVLRLIITNVVIFIILRFLPHFIDHNFFSLHKSNLFGLHTTQVHGFEKYYYYVSPTLNEPADSFEWVQIVTHFFNHGGFFHILFNMWALANFGSMIEMVFGAKRFLEFYLFCGVFGGLLCAFLDPSPIPIVGASGAIFGVMVAFAIYFPTQKLTFMMPFPITMEAKTWIIVLGIISAFFVFSDYFNLKSASWGGNISHFGHLAGMIAAIVFFYGESLIKK